MRLLPERADHDGQGAAGQNPNPTDAQIRRDGRDAVPLHDVLPRSGRHQARREGGRGMQPAPEGGGRMTPSPTFRNSRRVLETAAAAPAGLPQELRPAGRQLQRRGVPRQRSAQPRPQRPGAVRIPIPTSASSIRGSSSTRTTPPPSTSARPTAARAPARRSGR